MINEVLLGKIHVISVLNCQIVLIDVIVLYKLLLRISVLDELPQVLAFKQIILL